VCGDPLPIYENLEKGAVFLTKRHVRTSTSSVVFLIWFGHLQHWVLQAFEKVRSREGGELRWKFDVRNLAVGKA
jgi:hypothetical protein